MRSLQEEVLITWLAKLRKGSVYNRKWWNPLPFSMYVHDLIISEQLSSVIEVGTGNGVTSVWASLAGAHVWTCDTENRPKIWDDETFPLPHLSSRIEPFTMLGNQFLNHQLTRTSNVCQDLIILDGPTSEKGFRRLWSVISSHIKTGDFIVSPIGQPEIYVCWQKIANAGFNVQFNSSTESFTTKWDKEGNHNKW